MYQPDNETERNAVQYQSINGDKFATSFDISVKQILNNAGEALLKARRLENALFLPKYWALLISTLIFNFQQSWFCRALACIQTVHFYASWLFHIGTGQQEIYEFGGCTLDSPQVPVLLHSHTDKICPAIIWPMSHSINGPASSEMGLCHSTSVFSTHTFSKGGFMNQFSSSEGAIHLAFSQWTGEGDQGEDTEQNDTSRSHQPALKETAARNQFNYT